MRSGYLIGTALHGLYITFPRSHRRWHGVVMSCKVAVCLFGETEQVARLAESRRLTSPFRTHPHQKRTKHGLAGIFMSIEYTNSLLRCGECS